MEYFASSSHSVSSQRILYTPSEFARTSLLYLQETGSLHALAAHTSHREHLASYLFFSVTSGSGELNYNGKTYGTAFRRLCFIDCRKPYPMRHRQICGPCSGVIFTAILCLIFTKSIRSAADSRVFSSQGNGRIGRSYDRPVFCGRVGQLCAGYEN